MNIVINVLKDQHSMMSLYHDTSYSNFNMTDIKNLVNKFLLICSMSGIIWHIMLTILPYSNIHEWHSNSLTLVTEKFLHIFMCIVGQLVLLIDCDTDGFAGMQLLTVFI